MDIGAEGLANLAGFVRATAGRRGTSADVRGGVVVAGPVPVTHAYVDAAFPTDADASPADFLEDATAFFAEQARSFVVWAQTANPELLDELTRRGLTPAQDPIPAMVATAKVGGPVGVPCRVLEGDEAAEVVGDLNERGYQQPGMAWLMTHHDSYRAPETHWHVAFDGDVPVSTACGFRTGTTGGIYSVATPPEHRGHGYAAAITAAATNQLFDLGVERVVLQASRLGFGVYERLGFRTYDHFVRCTVPMG